VELGVTAVELMPVCEFDETAVRLRDPDSGERLRNLWGYAPIGLFAPKASLCARADDPMGEFRAMVREMHAAGIEVILDMVFNHTGEGDLSGPTCCFRGIDNATYYLTGPDPGRYPDHTGCGHTVNCNHPAVSDLVIDCLRHWAGNMRVDGFRFDLAPVLARGPDGGLMERPPLLERIEQDPVLAGVKLIAEPWDAAGAVLLGSFAARSPRWSEWNDRFRDEVKGFFSRTPVPAARLATRIAGSADIFPGRGPGASVNYVTCHDGFTLRDLVSYDRKKNRANGEDGRDGMADPFAWNSGCEGGAGGPEVEALRRRRMRSMLAVLLLSQGAVMLAAGDEFGRSRGGNNNPWCQDNPTEWLDWSLAEENRDLVRFLAGLVRLRRDHACFRRNAFFADAGGEVAWFGAGGEPDWSEGCHTLAMFLKHQPGGGEALDFLLLANGGTAGVPFLLPEGLRARPWRTVLDTDTDAAPLPFARAPRAPAAEIPVAGLGLVLLAAPA
jgi:glycogen operon protein